jgi:hypothetical protein
VRFSPALVPRLKASFVVPVGSSLSYREQAYHLAGDPQRPLLTRLGLAHRSNLTANSAIA